MRVQCFADYTCGYSYRAWKWLGVIQKARPLILTWRAFSLKEINREPDEPSPLADESLNSLSILALALGKAADARGVLEAYQAGIFPALHDGKEKLSRAEVLGVAAGAGIDVDEVQARAPYWLGLVVADHTEGLKRWGVFGTPTLVIDEEAAVYLKLTEVPEGEDALSLWDALCTLSVHHPELVEIKRPRPSD